MPTITGDSTGGSAITSYNLQYKVTGSISSFISLTGEIPSSTSTTYIKSGLVAGTSYDFIYRVKNIYGWSSFSNSISIIAATIPATPLAPTLTLSNGKDVLVSWTAPDNGGNAITGYKVLFKDSTGAFQENSVEWNASISPTKDNLKWIITFATMMASPFNLQEGASILAEVIAINSIGQSLASSTNSLPAITVQTIPHTPSQPPTLVSYSESEINLTLPTIDTSETGGSPILSYALYMQSGGDEILLTDMSTSSSKLQKSYSITGITAGDVYIFKYQVSNIFGWSRNSTTLSVEAVSLPGKMATVSTSIVSTNVRILWIEPYTGGNGITIDAYNVLILSSSGTYTSSQSWLITNTAIVSQLYWDVPMSEIISTTSGFGLTQGTLISVKVSAINSRGAGDFSDPNTSGAVVEIVPWQPSTTPRRGSQTTETQLEVTWDYLTGLSTGGSTILSYELQLNTGSGFVEVVGDSLGDYS